MNKTLKWILIIVGGLAVLGFGGMQLLFYMTKQHSPEEIVSYSKDDLNIEVYYNRPYKKGRNIFGDLVPYGQIWRTGANECSTFETNKELTINGETLPKGKYTLWTIPNENSWQVFFNSKMYGWGVNVDGSQVKDDAADVVVTTVPVQSPASAVEQFTITVDDTSDGAALNLAWDDVMISVPIQK
ncbi:MAG: DUF2911 domain-containing protein [Bacteroidota bacterium]